MANLCAKVQRHPLVNRALNEVARGDYFRKAFYVVVQSQEGSRPLPTPLSDAMIIQFVSASSLGTFDRLREMRNMQLHSRDSTSVEQLHTTRFSEVLACSKALQEMSRGLCRALSGPLPEIAAALSKRFSNLRPDRRRHAAKGALEQEYLLDATDVYSVLFHLAW